jgi:SHS2 domain-containing protein
MRFRTIEHTSDIGLIGYGKTLSEAFANAAYGLSSIMVELSNVREIESRNIEIHESNVEDLLFEWLNRLIYLFDVEMIIFKSFDIKEFNGSKLIATCYGEKFNPTHHKFKTGVKSATYYLLKVDEEKNQIQVIFDV